MSHLPKLKIKLPAGNPDEYIYELDEAGDVLNFSAGVFIFDGQWIHSYNELVNIAKQDKYKDREFIEVEWMKVMGGG
ncbi:hypothetical protein ACFL6W_06330 [Thermodesulfobacteriota bacterium]